MKKNNKLKLNKEVVSKLNDNEMSNLQGGALWTLFACPKSDKCPKSAECPSTENNPSTCDVNKDTCEFLDGCQKD